MWWRRGESNRRPLTCPDTLRPNASPVGDTRGERRCPHCGEDRLIDWCAVLMRWECAVCAKSWRADARLPREDGDGTVRRTRTLDFRARATHRKRNVGRVGSTDRRP
jgi:CRISPR/Cas system-associated protein Cas10 (large subunit of type III CRISPR-Cas system)